MSKSTFVNIIQHWTEQVGSPVWRGGGGGGGLGEGSWEPGTPKFFQGWYFRLQWTSRKHVIWRVIPCDRGVGVTGFLMWAFESSYYRFAVVLPWTKKKEPSPRLVVRRTLFHMSEHVRSRAISAGQKSRIVTDDLALRWLLVIKHDMTRSNSVLLSTNLGDGRKFTLPDAPSPWGGSCRYISRFASEPTKVLRQLQSTGARQAAVCLSPMINVLHM